MHVLNPSFPVAMATAGQRLATVLQGVGAACAAASGRTALDCVRLPEGVKNVNARTRRLVRQAQVSPW